MLHVWHVTCLHTVTKGTVRNFALPIATWWESDEELHFTLRASPPHFALPLRVWLDNILLLSGLGVEEQ